MFCGSDAAGQTVPQSMAPPTTICNRFNRWSHRGLWGRIFATLLDKAAPPRRLLADKGYDASGPRSRLALARTEAIIPSTRSCKTPTRYDKLASNFASAIAIAAIIPSWT